MDCNHICDLAYRDTFIGINMYYIISEFYVDISDLKQ